MFSPYQDNYFNITTGKAITLKISIAYLPAYQQPPTKALVTRWLTQEKLSVIGRVTTVSFYESGIKMFYCIKI